MKTRSSKHTDAYHFEDFTWYGDGWEGEAVIVCYYADPNQHEDTPSDSYRIWYL